MVLLVPLIVFLVLCILMMVVLSRTNPPTASETVEAYCDAILRRNQKIIDSLSTITNIPTTVTHTLEQIYSKHQEIAVSYDTRIIKDWVDENASYQLIGVPINKDEELQFECKYIVNLWKITKIKISSPKIGIDK